MKKILKTFVLIISIIILTACGNKKEVVKTCKLTLNDETKGYKIESKYIIYGKGKIVDKVQSTETITSEDNEILDYFDNILDSTYNLMNRTYGGYEVDISKENNKVISKVIIDYSKIDMKAYIKDNPDIKEYLTKKNEVLISGIEELYEKTGAVCE